MPSITRRFAMAIVLAGCAAAVSTDCAAQTPGPLRERIAARLAEKRAAGQAADAAADDFEGQASGAANVVLPAGARLVSGLPYGRDPKERMDLYIPAGAGKAPVIFMVHGGGWRLGSKSGRGVVQNKVTRWVSRGFIVISADYPLLPQADPLAQADAVARAVASAQKSAPSWGGDPTRFMLMGHSAGAHLVALLNSQPSRALAQGVQPWLGTIALDSAVMDVAPVMRGRHLPMYDKAFGADPDFWRQASPVQVLEKDATPLLAVCSSRRRDNPCGAAEKLAARYRAMAVRAQVLPQDRSHGEINDQLGLPGPYTDAVEAFMASLDPQVRALLAAR